MCRCLPVQLETLRVACFKPRNRIDLVSLVFLRNCFSFVFSYSIQLSDLMMKVQPNTNLDQQAFFFILYPSKSVTDFLTATSTPPGALHPLHSEPPDFRRLKANADAWPEPNILNLFPTRNTTSSALTLPACKDSGREHPSRSFLRLQASSWRAASFPG